VARVVLVPVTAVPDRPNAVCSAPDSVKLVLGLLALRMRCPLPSSVAETAPELPRPEVPLMAASIQRLCALADLIEKGAQIIGAIVQRLRLEIARRIVEGGVDLLAGRKVFLGRRQIRGGILQRKQILPYSLT
jgi:hypothetical protein